MDTCNKSISMQVTAAKLKEIERVATSVAIELTIPEIKVTRTTGQWTPELATVTATVRVTVTVRATEFASSTSVVDFN